MNGEVLQHKDRQVIYFGPPAKNQEFLTYDCTDLRALESQLALEGIDADRRAFVIEHESQHLQAAAIMGVARKAFFRIEMTPVGSHNVSILLRNWRLPRLALAAFYAAPSELSALDLKSLDGIGYLDIGVLPDKIAAWNEAELQFKGRPLEIPMPLWA